MVPCVAQEEGTPAAVGQAAGPWAPSEEGTLLPGALKGESSQNPPFPAVLASPASPEALGQGRPRRLARASEA